MRFSRLTGFRLRAAPVAGALCLALAGTAAAQQGYARYYITARGVATAHDELLADVKAVAVPIAGLRTGVVADINFPRLNLSAVAAVLTPEEVQRIDPTRYRVVPDVVLVPNGSGPPLGAAWPMDQFCTPAPDPHWPGTPPVVYIVDTGVDCTHPEFTSGSALTILPGLSYGVDLTIPPGTPLDPCTDPYDHGTRMAGCLGGGTTGLLGGMGGSAMLKPVGIYDFPPGGPLATYVSQAISGILGAVADHQARRAGPYLRSRASVLLFANSTTVAGGRFADLDRAIEIAWEEGMHVVMSAGNEGVNAALVSPAGAAWGYEKAGVPQRFFFGAPPAGATFYRAADEFLVAGAYGPAGAGYALWPGTNKNLSASVDPVDGFGPGVNVPAAQSGGGYGMGTGTSYAAAETAALVTWAAYVRPWASPADIRKWVRTARTAGSGFQKIETPAAGKVVISWTDWIAAYFPAPALPGMAGAMDNPDGDALPNFAEYYCGSDPRFPDSALPELNVSHDGTNVTLTTSVPLACYLRATPEVRWELQRSTDLITWMPVTLTTFAPQPGPVVAGDGIMQDATAVISPAAAPREYFRHRFYAPVPLP